MKKKVINKISLLLNIILILFLAFYFLVSFLNYGILKTTFTPICFLVEKFQGEKYMPAWCNYLDEEIIAEPNKNSNINKNTNTNINIANPASEECIVQGAKVEMYSNDSGQFGVCVFDDNSICEEWALYRGECKKGECFKVCKYVGSSNEGWYISCTRQLLKLEKCGTKEETNEVMSNDIKPDQLIVVTAPVAGSQLNSPVTIEGRAKISGDKVYIKFENNSGTILIEDTAPLGAAADDGYKNFSRKINYEFSATKEGYIKVFSLSSSGVEENLVSISVKY
ncbi:DUF333 domain-containing protein [Candidatus Falkowbacteria bacterium]|nr:DUF333 domain-containing protein [Candidatus Falkowbacteria bacterium]